MNVQTTDIDEAKLHDFVGRVVADLGAASSAALVFIGDRLGLYRALAEGGPQTPEELASRTGTAPRYVREWLLNQATGGYVQYHSGAQRYALSPEQAYALADDASPVYLQGGFQVVTDVYAMTPRLLEAFRTGEGIGWHEHTSELFAGVERFFRPGYRANLTSAWIPALEGVEAKLAAGAQIADVGCGHGASTLLLAEAYPASRFNGFDYHQSSIDRANQAAREAGLGDRARFEVAGATDYPGRYDLIAFFDCLHDMGDPVAACVHARGALNPDGTVMIVEPFANDRIEDNLNPVGRVYSAASTFICIPSSLSQPVGLALGAQAGEARLWEVVSQAGFTRFRRAAETPFNIVYEARP